ncbi:MULTISPECIES: hypothetical protein [Mycolicibacter]|uniref:Uncharacterized protein n=2 Tax=Mycolicibacter TaxID=1073531 RepID=A0ABU5XM68_9MYCO|nr:MULTISPECIES: hypothetical protein [unclassified Mycolicibacter]MEB3023376.1 hypothetical protein [Mycolicibacter sp. MYC098]MEB3033718.1 hypothetical protein [Mycolicibacter sp. MYC340]
MSGMTVAVYAIDSGDTQYVNATYTIDELDDGAVQVYVDYESGHSDDAAHVESAEALSTDQLLEEIDRQLRGRGLPPRGTAVIAPS